MAAPDPGPAVAGGVVVSPGLQLIAVGSIESPATEGWET
jgi:hypothetical protein